MIVRNIIFISLFANAPFQAVGQNLDANDIFNLGNQLLKGMQQPQTVSPQQVPSTPQVQSGTRAPAHNAGEVSEAQSLLTQLGYDPGVVDGVMGNRTSQAIRQFQGDQGLPQTGQPSSELLVQLWSVLQTQAKPNTAIVGVPQPSFDCARAGNPVEYAICGSTILADKDRELLGAYEEALAHTRDPELLRLQQRSWIQQRNRCGGSEACLAGEMEKRIAELRQLGVSPSVPLTPTQSIGQEAPTIVQGTSEPLQSRSVRQDGILVHASGALIVPGPLFNPGTPEFRQHRALGRYLLHAAAGRYPDELVPTDNPSVLAERARDYLPLADVRPYLCTPAEMNSQVPDCMSFSDASYAYSVGGGQLDPQGDTPREADFLWWRGANEFERRRNIAEFVAANGLRDRIIETAPETPVQLVYSVQSVLGSYDFAKSAFPVMPIGGAIQIRPPGSKPVEIDLAEVERPISVSASAAEAMLGELERRDNGDPIIYIGVTVALTPDQPHGGQPRWTAEKVSAGYYMDAELARPIETADALSGQAQLSASQALVDSSATANTVSGGVIRDFQLKREDGRAVIDFTGYKEPTATSREAVFNIQASAARSILKSFEDDENRYNLDMLASIVNDDVRGRYFTDKHFFAGHDEFAVQRNRQSFRSDVVPLLLSEAPTLPIPVRLYLAATLDEYDFDKKGFPVRTFQDPGIWVNFGPPFSLQPAFELTPGFVPMPPDAAEKLVSTGPSDLKLRIDFDVTGTDFQLPQVTMAVRPISVALVSGGSVYFEKSYAKDHTVAEGNAEKQSDLAAAAKKFLGPERAGVSVPEQPNDYPVNGIAPGMSLEAALEQLSQHFSANEISLSHGILRAERGVCTYSGVDSNEIESELNTICLVAQVTNDRIARVVLRQVVVTGLVSELLDIWRSSFGTEVSRGDGGAPNGSIGREFLGWGAEIDSSRSALGRAEVSMASHETELDITYLSPRASVVVARSDFASVSQVVAKPTAAPKKETESTASPETSAGLNSDNLSILGIRLGASRDEALSMVAKADEIVYQIGFTASNPAAIDENADAIALANGEWFVLHYDGDKDPRKVIGVVRRIRVESSVPMEAVREAMTGAYGAPTWEEDNGGGWTDLHWRTDGTVASCNLIDWRDGTMFGGAAARERGDIKRVPMAQGRSGGNNRAFIQVADLVTFIDATFTNSESDKVALSTCPVALDASLVESSTSEHTILMRLVDPLAFDPADETATETQPAASFNIKLK